MSTVAKGVYEAQLVSMILLVRLTTLRNAFRVGRSGTSGAPKLRTRLLPWTAASSLVLTKPWSMALMYGVLAPATVLTVASLFPGLRSPLLFAVGMALFGAYALVVGGAYVAMGRRLLLSRRQLARIRRGPQ